MNVRRRYCWRQTVGDEAPNRPLPDGGVAQGNGCSWSDRDAKERHSFAIGKATQERKGEFCGDIHPPPTGRWTNFAFDGFF
jgi:hypothetical protein